jgi:signal transduction histidine kinase
VLELEINDNGVGLTPSSTAGLAMLSMQARAVEVGGTFSVDTLPGK